MLAEILLSLVPSFVEEAPAPKTLGRLPADCEPVIGTLRFAADGSQFACVVIKGKKKYPFVGGKLGDPFDELFAPRIHSNGAHVAFRAIKNGIRYPTFALIYDGKVLIEDDWITDVAFSPVDGTPAFWVSHGNINNADGSIDPGPGWVQIGKAKGKKWQANEGNPPSFTADGKFAVSVGTKGGSASVFRIDTKGKEDVLASNDHYYLEAVVSPDGREFACSYRTGSSRLDSDEDRTFAVGRMKIGDPKADKVIEFSTNYASAGAPVFSRDSKHLAHKILVDGKYGAVLDGVKGGTPEFDFVDELTISPDGNDLAYVAGLQCTVDQGQGFGVLAGAKAVGSRWLVVHGGGRSAEFNAAHEPTWSPDGKALAFVGCKKSEWRVYVGKQSSAPHQEISGLVFSADGKSVAYGCRNGVEIQWCTMTLP